MFNLHLKLPVFNELRDPFLDKPRLAELIRSLLRVYDSSDHLSPDEIDDLCDPLELQIKLSQGNCLIRLRWRKAVLYEQTTELVVPDDA